MLFHIHSKAGVEKQCGVCCCGFSCETQLLVNIIEEQLSPSGCCYLFPTKPLIYNTRPASIFYDYQPFTNTPCTLFIIVSNHTGTAYHQCTPAPFMQTCEEADKYRTLTQTSAHVTCETISQQRASHCEHEVT